MTATNLDGARCALAPPQGAPAILLSKLTLGQAGGPFAFQLNNTSQTTGTATTTTAGVAVQVDGDTTRVGIQPFTLLNANLGNPLTITESSLPSGWTIDNARCTLNGTDVGSLNRTTRVYTVPGNLIVTGNNFICQFDNRRLQADLAVNKATQGGTGAVVVGSTITYQVTVTNNGPDAVTGATVTDTPVSGVNCPDSTPVSCTTAGNCPAGPINLGNLKAGVTMPTLAMNASATFTFSCVVN